MNREKIKEGDICILDESIEYSYNPHKPYEVLVLWHGVNSQPLVTRLDKYKPFWTTYSQLTEVKRHIDLSFKALEQQTCEDCISREDALMALTGEWTESTDELIHRFIRRIRKLPSVKPVEKQELCEDAVSRQAVEKITWEEPSYTDALNVLTEVREKIRQLPSVNPQPICEEREKGECPYYAG